MTIHQAAVALDISESTVRRRIKDGSLQAWRIPPSQEFVWWILLDEQDPATAGEQLATIADLAASSIIEQLHLLVEQRNAERGRGEELQRQNVELAGRCGRLQARLEAAEKQVLSLTAPPALEHPSAPRWKRLLGLSPAASKGRRGV